MSVAVEEYIASRPTHRWLRRIHTAFVPGPNSPLLEDVATNLKHQFRRLGHIVQDTPDDSTDVILTTAQFGEPLSLRQCLQLNARRRFRLSSSPTIWTLMPVTPSKFWRFVDRLRSVLDKDPPDPADFDFPGLAPQAYRVLHEQGRRGGPIMALERVVQAQSKSIRNILIVGEERPEEAYHFDLVGSHPRIKAQDLDAFYEDMVLRIVTAVSTVEVNQHQTVDEPVPPALWKSLRTPGAMSEAGQQLGRRSFFTEMVHIPDLVDVPVVGGVISSQYSEGCFASWDPILGALIATVTGSARPVDKSNITADELAVIVGVRSDGKGALVRDVEGKRNDPPSTEAVELMDMDSALPTIAHDFGGASVQVPIVRSKLHGHRGISAYDPSLIEHVALDPPFYHYPVTCGTDAQAHGIKIAFARSEALQNPHDPRQLAFTVLPGHGVVIAEKWVADKAPFQMMWESMDTGQLVVDNFVPQGLMTYVLDRSGMMVLEAAESLS